MVDLSRARPMFSGIVDAIGQVQAMETSSNGKTLVVRAEGYWTDVATGASIAIDGVCLTVTRVERNDARFDVITETLRRTTLGGLRTGGLVNLQKSLAVGDRVDGHFVQGHVDAIATIDRVERSAADYICWFVPDASAMSYIIPKGGVSIDGVSLTVAEVRDDRFSVALIPTTLERTSLGNKGEGDRVNIETDILARTVVHHLQSLGQVDGAGGLTLESLRRAGFVSAD
ncbi:MAG: riboflavin synthase [Planctomycetota bacterium]|nr:riboflavin synthase [Planctomycetota bacterium]